ncbi:MAG: class I SAM-dependent methyltransferase [Deltaproteobacteria bacterium]
MKSAKRKLLEQRAEEAQALRTPAAEQLLIEEIPSISATRILCTSLGRGQFARVASSYSPCTRVVCHFFDTWLARQAAEHCNVAGTPGVPSAEATAATGNLEIVCTPDFPPGPFDLVAIPVDPRGEAELTRDLLQTGHDRLVIGGRMLAATSIADDQRLHGEMRKLFEKVTRQPQENGVLYLASKTAPLKKHKNFNCEFAFRDQGRLVRAVSRPGVFSHRSLDAGARALINTMTIRDNDRILDIGCGSGAVALAAAFRARAVTGVAVDSHARAVECVTRGAALNGLSNVTAILDHEGRAPEPGTYDLVLGNPPYYSDYQIAEVFLQAARRALKPRGKVLMVAKSYAWYETRMPELFDDVQLHPHKQYTVVEGMDQATCSSTVSST